MLFRQLLCVLRAVRRLCENCPRKTCHTVTVTAFCIAQKVFIVFFKTDLPSSSLRLLNSCRAGSLQRCFVLSQEVHNCKCDGGNTAAGNLQANGMGRKKRKRQGSGKKGRPKGTGEKRPKTEKPDSYSCELCGCVLKTRRGLKYHQSKHTGVYNFRCPLCNKGYNRRHTLNIHINAHSGIKNYVCERCGKALQSNGSLCQHKKFCHVADEDKKKYSCNLCDKFYFRSKSLQMHIEQVHENKYLHHCDYCGELTTSRKSRMLHAGGLCKGAKYKTDIDWDNMPNDGKLRCRQCGKAFTRKDSLLEHVESVHEKTRKHKCEGCDQLFKTRGAKSNHRRFYCKNLPHETRPQEAGEAAEPGAGLVAAEALPTLPEVQPPFLAL